MALHHRLQIEIAGCDIRLYIRWSFYHRVTPMNEPGKLSLARFIHRCNLKCISGYHNLSSFHWFIASSKVANVSIEKPKETKGFVLKGKLLQQSCTNVQLHEK